MKHLVAIIFSLATLLSNFLFLWSSEGVIYILSLTFTILSGIARFFISARALLSKNVKNPVLENTNRLLYFLPLTLCILSPQSMFFLANFSDIMVHVKIISHLTASTLLFQDMPQFSFQIHSLFTSSVSTVTLLPFILNSLSIFVQIAGLAAARAIQSKKIPARRLSNAVQMIFNVNELEMATQKSLFFEKKSTTKIEQNVPTSSQIQTQTQTGNKSSEEGSEENQGNEQNEGSEQNQGNKSIKQESEQNQGNEQNQGDEKNETNEQSEQSEQNEIELKSPTTGLFKHPIIEVINSGSFNSVNNYKIHQDD
eukprot:c11905_g1_i1.p1 GENE.c11905_g1_i1~~c11905_g1_i1.p1  ORF type:complete len:349 (-),score=72.65 c11905_g1_i1:26-958(-)